MLLWIHNTEAPSTTTGGRAGSTMQTWWLSGLVDTYPQAVTWNPQFSHPDCHFKIRKSRKHSNHMVRYPQSVTTQLSFTVQLHTGSWIQTEPMAMNEQACDMKGVYFDLICSNIPMKQEGTNDTLGIWMTHVWAMTWMCLRWMTSPIQLAGFVGVKAHWML